MGIWEVFMSLISRCRKSLQATAAEIDGRTWSYSVSSSTASITRVLPGDGEVNIPSEVNGYKVTRIESSAFRGCGGLKSVTIPSSVTSIDKKAFQACSGIKSFSVAHDNPIYSSANGLLLTKDGTELIAGVNGDVQIPSGVTSIGERAFYDCISLTSVTIPSDVASIGEYAFYGCISLTSVTILGNAPDIADSILIPSDAVVYVMRGATGWDVQIPGTWKGCRIEHISRADALG